MTRTMSNNNPATALITATATVQSDDGDSEFSTDSVSSHNRPV